MQQKFNLQKKMSNKSNIKKTLYAQWTKTAISLN